MTHEIGSLRGLLEAATAWGLRIADPLEDAMPALKRYGRVGKSKERDRRPTADELKRLRDAFTGRRLPMADLMDFSIATAMRLGELARVRWADLDEDGKLLLIRDRKDPEEKEGNDQWIPLLGEALPIIQRQVKHGPRIFPFHEDSIGRAWRDTCERLKVVDLHWHDLRHEGTSRLFEMGYQIQEVALVTGHRDWKSLKRYTNLLPASLHRPDPC
jgi:integrase